ncbi:putative pyridoxal phosphate-dependent enzyme [Marinovum algicola DG 898]|nr:putative pyridoxal phosphate-dependent enzyme [Marinovum algicola DG 898]
MIPVCIPEIGDGEIEQVVKSMREGWISSEGPAVAEFEALFSDFVGCDHGIAVCNGTAAVEVALYAAGVGAGDEVILPSFTIISCAIAVLRLGATPILVDIDPDTWCMQPEDVAAKLTSRTRAIMAVHLFGHPVDMDPIVAVARDSGVMIVEDASQAHGALYKDRIVGGIGDVAAYSFYANKIITTGEGGMVVTRDPDMAARARSYRNLCFNPEQRFLHDDIGYNFRMSALQAAIGVAQMAEVDRKIERKRRLGALYAERLAQIPGVRSQTERPWAKTVYWMYSLQMAPQLGHTARQVMDALGNKGIGTRPFFMGLHDQPALRKHLPLSTDERFPVTDAAYKYGFYLPSSLSLTEEQINTVCCELAEVLRNMPGDNG